MQVPKPTRYGEKFYRSRWNNLALILAVGAAMLTYAFLTWPIAVPQGHGDLGPVWGVVAFIAAATYLYAAWKADMNWRLSRMIPSDRWWHPRSLRSLDEPAHRPGRRRSILAQRLV